MKGAQILKVCTNNKKCAIALCSRTGTLAALLLKSAEAKRCAVKALLLTLCAPLKKNPLTV